MTPAGAILPRVADRDRRRSTCDEEWKDGRLEYFDMAQYRDWKD